MQAVQSLLGEALVEHPGSVYLRIMVARYLIMFRSNDYLALAHLKIARVCLIKIFILWLFLFAFWLMTAFWSVLLRTSCSCNGAYKFLQACSTCAHCLQL